MTEKEQFYFTYGSDEKFPYQNGYTIVAAENIHEACTLFNTVHAKREESNCMNCAFYYTEEQWNKWDKRLRENYPCFERIAKIGEKIRVTPIDRGYIII